MGIYVGKHVLQEENMQVLVEVSKCVPFLSGFLDEAGRTSFSYFVLFVSLDFLFSSLLK